MNEDELRAFVEQELHKVTRSMEGKMNVGPQTEEILRTQAERTLKELKAKGYLATSRVHRVASFSSLSPAEQTRILAMYRSWKQYSGQPVTALKGNLSEEEYRWLVREEWRVPDNRDAELREEATYEGIIDWEIYQDLVHDHPDAYLIGLIEDPRSRMLLDFSVTPIHPIHYLKVEIKLEGE